MEQSLSISTYASQIASSSSSPSHHYDQIQMPNIWYHQYVLFLCVDSPAKPTVHSWQPVAVCVTYDASEPRRVNKQANAKKKRFNLQCFEMDAKGREKNQLRKCEEEKVYWGKIQIEGGGGKKKVLAHQSCVRAVGGDISLVHFVNREIVCGESGRARVTRKDRKTQR